MGKERFFWRSPMIFWRYLRPQSGRVILLALLLSTGILLALLNPQVIRYFLDTAQQGTATDSLRPLIFAAILFIGFAILQQAVGLASNLLGQRISWSATNRLRADLTLHCLRLDLSFHKRRTPGEMIERIDGDVEQLGNYFSQFLLQVIGNSLLVGGILILLFREDWLVGLVMLAYVLLTLAILGGIQKPSSRRWESFRQSDAEMFGFIEERISGSDEIRAIGAEAYTVQRLLDMVHHFNDRLRSAFLVSSLSQNLTLLIAGAGYALSLILGVYLYNRNQASLGTVYLLVFYTGMLTDPLQQIRAQFQDWQQASVCLGRVRELFNQKSSLGEAESTHLAKQPSIAEKEHLVLAPASSVPGDGATVSQAPRLVVDQVSFSYPAENNPPELEPSGNILQDISFSLEACQVLGVLGRTGSGKSTLTRLLFRLYDPQSGRIALDGTDVRSLPLSELRTRIGLVTQEVQLFDGTVRDNLTFFDRSIPDQQLHQALERVGLLDWLQRFPAGLETRLAAAGQGLSAGEAQLLALGRLCLKNPGLIILDEASSRLDPSTERLMEIALEPILAGRTCLIIAHRLQTVMRADSILILENGRVLEFGSRAGLMADPASRFNSLLKTGLEEVLV